MLKPIVIILFLLVTLLLLGWSILGYQNSANNIRHVLTILPEKYFQTFSEVKIIRKCVHFKKVDWKYPPASEVNVQRRESQECFTADVVLKYSYLDYLFFGYSALVVTTEPRFDLEETLNSPTIDLLAKRGFPGVVGSFFDWQTDRNWAYRTEHWNNNELNFYRIKGARK